MVEHKRVRMGEMAEMAAEEVIRRETTEGVNPFTDPNVSENTKEKLSDIKERLVIDMLRFCHHKEKYVEALANRYGIYFEDPPPKKPRKKKISFL